MTLAATFAESFTALVVWRSLTGIGEACFASLAPALIGDLYTGDRRTRFLTLFYFTVPFGW